MKGWVKDLFLAIDRMDADGFSAFLTKECAFCFGNAPAVYDRENIRDYVANFFSSIKGLAHRILETWEFGQTVICEGEVTYIRRDDKKITLPFVDIFRMEQGLIADYRVYMDISPLFAPLQNEVL